MKNVTIATAFAASICMTSVASAGSLADPVVDPVLVTADATSSSSGAALVAALALLMIIPVAD